jgi:hypothetical protein
MTATEFQVNGFEIFHDFDQAWTAFVDPTTGGSTWKLSFTHNGERFCVCRSSFNEDIILVRGFTLVVFDPTLFARRLQDNDSDGVSDEADSDEDVHIGAHRPANDHDWNIIARGDLAAVRAAVVALLA